MISPAHLHDKRVREGFVLRGAGALPSRVIERIRHHRILEDSSDKRGLQALGP